MGRISKVGLDAVSRFGWQHPSEITQKKNLASMSSAEDRNIWEKRLMARRTVKNRAVRADGDVAGEGARRGGERAAEPARPLPHPGCRRLSNSAGPQTACVVGPEDGVLGWARSTTFAPHAAPPNRAHRGGRSFAPHGAPPSKAQRGGRSAAAEAADNPQIQK
jgi:hypothetical protein